jgi:hypothetical protein
MTTNRRSASVMGVVLAFDRRIEFKNLKRSMLMLLGVWIAYFVIVEAFIRTLGHIIVPIVNVPLSVLLVAQGGVLLFLGALYLLARRGREAVAAAFVAAASSPRRHGRAGRRPSPGHPRPVSIAKDVDGRDKHGHDRGKCAEVPDFPGVLPHLANAADC